MVILSVILGLLLINIFEFSHKFGVKIVFVADLQEFACSLQPLIPVFQGFLGICLLYEESWLGVVIGKADLGHLLDVLRRLFALLQLLLLILVVDHLLQESAILSLFRVVSEVAHSILNAVNELQHLLDGFVAATLGFFEDFREDLVDNIGITTVHSKFQSLVMFVDL